jgi:hypothetical protein
MKIPAGLDLGQGPTNATLPFQPRASYAGQPEVGAACAPAVADLGI